MNYMAGKIYIYDLQSNVPVQNHICNGRNMSNKTFKDMTKYPNQKKIFCNNTKFLDIQKPGVIMLNNTRLELTFWKNLES